MERALRTLLNGVIDYAGLFPPAKLEMEPASEEYLEHRDGPECWVMSRFACPALHLPELAGELEKHELKESVAVTVIGTSGKDKHHWDTALKLDEAAIAAFRKRIVNRAVVECYEMRLPDNHHTEDCLRLLERVDVNELFVEVPWSDGMEESIACIAGCEFAFAKVRTGGADASSFPSVCELAAFIQQCGQLDVPMKLTAGLHQPLPHHDSATGADMHGFLNVLVAATLSSSHDLTRKEIEAILSCRQIEMFHFDATKLKWGDHQATIEEIEAGRDFFRAFGSCSVREPLEGLAKLGLAVPVATEALTSG